MHCRRRAGRRDGSIVFGQVYGSAFCPQPGPSAAAAVNCIAISADGKLLAFGDSAGNVGVYYDIHEDLAAPSSPRGPAKPRGLARTTSSVAAIGIPLPVDQGSRPGAAVQQSGDAAVTCCAFSPDGSQLATGHACGRVMLWDLQSGSPAIISFNMELHSSPVTSCCFWSGQPHKRRLISSASDCIAVVTDMLAVRQGIDGVRYVLNVLGSSGDKAGQGPGQDSGQQHQPARLHSCQGRHGKPLLLQVQPCGQAMAFVTSRKQHLHRMDKGQGQSWALQQRHIDWSHKPHGQQQAADAAPQQSAPQPVVKSRPLCSLRDGVLARAQYVHAAPGSQEGRTTISLFQDSQPEEDQQGSQQAADQQVGRAAPQPGNSQYAPNLGDIHLPGLEVTTVLLGVEVGVVAMGCIRRPGDCSQGESLVVLKAHHQLLDVARAKLGEGTAAHTRADCIWR